MPDEPERILRGLPGRGRPPQTFGPGDTVRVRAGAFAAFAGKVEAVNRGRRLLKVRVEIFGRETHVRLGFADVEKVSFG